MYIERIDVPLTRKRQTTFIMDGIFLFLFIITINYLSLIILSFYLLYYLLYFYFI